MSDESDVNETNASVPMMAGPGYDMDFLYALLGERYAAAASLTRNQGELHTRLTQVYETLNHRDKAVEGLAADLVKARAQIELLQSSLQKVKPTTRRQRS